MCPIVPTFTCGFVRSNFSFPILSSSLSSSLFVRPTLRFADNFVSHAARHFLITREMHRVLGTALRARSHMSRIPEHCRQRNDVLDHLRARAVLHPLNAPTARTQVAHDRAGEIFRR